MMLAPAGSSPRMRGTRAPTALTSNVFRIIPAHAGNTWRAAGCRRLDGDHPRACGEHFPLILFRGICAGSSPRMRGTRGRTSLPPWIQGIIPAHAGNTDANTGKGMWYGDHPRACGEHLAALEGRRRGLGIIPAHAGNTDSGANLAVGAGDHPRACGEHSLFAFCSALLAGSSPRMRGTQYLCSEPVIIVGIIPAHAGNTIAACFVLSGDMGSSPRMRGTHSHGTNQNQPSGIIPAHAGNTGLTVNTMPSGWDHPRACGEHK